MKRARDQPRASDKRPALGRERGRFSDEREPIWLRVALDALARHRATREPLERALDHGMRAARLGPRERRRAGDLAFAWARSRELVEGLVAEAVKRFGGIAPPVRARDCAALSLAALSSGLAPVEATLPSPLAELVEEAREVGVGALSRSSHAAVPAWLLERLTARFGDETAALVEALRRPAPVVLAVDVRHVAVDEARAAVEKLGVRTEPSRVSPVAVRALDRFPLSSLPRAVRDHVWPMDDGSQAVVHALEAGPDDVVLDLCAGGGGKTRLLLSRGARVVALDPDAVRLAATARRARGQGVASCVRGDGGRPPFGDGVFSAVLVDAPCSGTGTLRRAPDLADRFRPASLDELTALQLTLLCRARDLVAPGGRVVYATCSLLPDENERVVDEALARCPDLAPLGTRTLLPSEEGTDGFFIARLRRR